MIHKRKRQHETFRHLRIVARKVSPKPIILEGEHSLQVTVEHGAQAIIFHQISDTSVADIDVILQEGSALTYIFHSEGKGARIRSTVGASANMIWHCFTVGSDATYDLESKIIGADATSQINWVFKAGEKEKQIINIKNNFKAKNGGGEIVLKGVAEGHAHVVCNGMIEIGLEGGGTKTHLTEDVLMLDATAKVDAIPGLEIKTNDVKASHSATVSRVTAEQLFYLQSRGLPEVVARKLFIDGFLGELIEHVPESLRKQVRLVLAA